MYIFNQEILHYLDVISQKCQLPTDKGLKRGGKKPHLSLCPKKGKINTLQCIADHSVEKLNGADQRHRSDSILHKSAKYLKLFDTNVFKS